MTKLQFLFYIALLAGGMLFSPTSALSQETKPDKAPGMDVQIYYSKDDPDWKATSDMLEAIAKTHQGLRLTTISIDTQEGYRKLAAVEKRLKITRPGDITAVMGNHVLINRGSQKDINLYFKSSITRLLSPGSVKGKRETKPSSFAREHFGKDLILTLENKPKNKDIRSFRVERNGKVLGWVTEAFQKISCPVCNDVQFMVAVQSENKQVLEIRPIRALERWGKPLSTKEAQQFTDQFKHFNAKELKKGEAQIDAISGATKTSLAYKKAMLTVLKELINLTPKSSSSSK